MIKKVNNNLYVDKNHFINNVSGNIVFYDNVINSFLMIDKMLFKNGITNEFVEYLSTFEGSDYFNGYHFIEYRLQMDKVHKTGKLYQLFNEYQQNIKQDGVNIDKIAAIIVLYSTKDHNLYLNIGLTCNGGYYTIGLDTKDKILKLKDFFNSKNKIIKAING